MLQDIVLVFRWLMLASGILLGASISLSDLRAKQGQTLLLGFGPAKLRFAMVASLAALMFTLIAEMAIRSWLQYQAFAAGGPGQYLLPPHQPISYFLNYATFHFVLWRALGLALGVLVLAGLLVKWPKSAALQQRLSIGEIYLLAFGIAAAGWPNLLVFIVAAAALYATILFALTLWAFLRKQGAMPRFPVALPLTLALIPALLFGAPILDALNLDFLRISLFSF